MSRDTGSGVTSYCNWKLLLFLELHILNKVPYVVKMVFNHYSEDILVHSHTVYRIVKDITILGLKIIVIIVEM